MGKASVLRHPVVVAAMVTAVLGLIGILVGIYLKPTAAEKAQATLADSPVSLSVKNAQFEVAVRQVAEQIGATTAVDAGLGRELVTMEIEGVRFKDLMKNICSMYGCEWTLTVGKDDQKAVVAVTRNP